MDAAVVLFSLFLLASAVGLMLLHARTWREFRERDHDVEDFDYRRRQYRRRMQVSAMIGLLAIALFVGWMLMNTSLFSVTFFAVYWIVVMLVTCWVLLLALVDIWATKYHYGRLRDRCLIEQARLRAEAVRIRSIRGNGKGETSPRKIGEKGKEAGDEG